MTNREREFAALGFKYSEGIEGASTIIHPITGREIRKTAGGRYEAQPYNDNYWLAFDDLLDAIKCASPPKTVSDEVTIELAHKSTGEIVTFFTLDRETAHEIIRGNSTAGNYYWRIHHNSLE